MNTLTNNELITISGGDLLGWIDGACSVIGLGGVGAWIIGVSLGPVGQTAVAACAVYGAGRILL